MRWLGLLLLFPSLAVAGEDCAMMGGTCRDVCAVHEEVEKGAFLDCSDKQECCVKKEAIKNMNTNSPVKTKDSDQKTKAGQ